MNLLVVYAHPSPTSFQASLLEALTVRLREAGHTLRVLDLYAEAFDPVLRLDGWRAHREHHAFAGGLETHIQALSEADGLIFLYPTWWYGLPAILKGWIDRVWQPGVAFELETGVFQTRYLRRIKRFVVITTYGSPRYFIEWVVGDPVRRQLARGLALQFGRGVRTAWLPIYDVDRRSPGDLAGARDRVVTRAVKSLLSHRP